MTAQPSDIGRFFDSLTSDYTATIERCFPRYREMLWAILEYLPPDRTIRSVLELGCGTGNLTVLIRNAFPDAALTVVDVANESLDECRRRIDGGSGSAVRYVAADFGSVEFDPGEFDLVVSSIAVHHVDAAAKQTLFRDLYGWLADGGVFCYSDQCAGVAADTYSRHMQNWKTIAMQAGSTEEEWEMWMRHQQDCDHHDTLGDQLDWLKQSGFETVDCMWRYLLWSVIQARK